MSEPKALITREFALSNGLLKFFTGKPCRQAHVSDRYTKGGVCTKCAALNSKAYSLNNPEAKKAADAAWAAANKERSRATNKEWLKNNPEKRAATLARHNAKARTKEVNRIASARIRERNPGKATVWKRANPMAARTHSLNYLARKRQAEGTHTSAEISLLLERQKFKCVNCKASLKRERHLDHIVALANGGRNDITNLQWMCPMCNSSKKARDPIEWAQCNGRLL